jgi:hypothetical protein
MELGPIAIANDNFPSFEHLLKTYLQAQDLNLAGKNVIAKSECLAPTT